MISLFIDSSRKELSVALINNDKLISSVNVESYSKHSNFLMNTIKFICEQPIECSIAIIIEK